MARNGLTLVGFEKVKNILDPKKFERRLKKQVEKATSKNGELAAGKIKESINKSNYPKAVPNAPLTQLLKKSSRPLVDSGELSKSITADVRSWDVVFVGINRNRVKKGAKGASTGIVVVAKALHDGVRQMRVTDKMRNFFYWLANVNEATKGKVLPLSRKTKFITIPPRPFLFAALKNVLIKRYTREWMQAVRRTLQGKDL